MCFSLGWFENLLIWIVIIGAIFAIFRLLLPLVFAQLGAPGNVIMQVLNILLWAVVVIFVIILCFDLISCLAGGGFSLGLGPRR